MKNAGARETGPGHGRVRDHRPAGAERAFAAKSICGESQLIHTIELVKERLNKKLVMEGVVFTMYDARTNLSLQVVENVKDNLQQNIYKTIIPRNIKDL